MNDSQDKGNSNTLPVTPVAAGAQTGSAGKLTAPKGAAQEAFAAASKMQTAQAGRPAPAVKNTTGRVGSFPRALLILLLVTSVAGLGYYAWEQQKAIDILFGEYNTLNQQSNAVEQQLEALEAAQLAQQTLMQEQLREAEIVMNSQAAQIDALNRDLVTTRMRITDSGAGASQAWMLTEAESLMRFAQQRLLLARDIRSAIGLNISADDLLKQFNDPAVFMVREALANDLAILQGVREVDVQNLYLQLGATIERVQQLSIRTASDLPLPVNETLPDGRTLPDGVPVAEPAADESSGWWDNIGNRLGQYFVLTRGDEAPIPVLTSDQAWLLKQNQVLILEQARVALLKGQQETWQSALDAAISGISINLTGENKDFVLNALTNLRSTSIQTSIPPASNGLNAIRQILPQANITESAVL